MAERKKIVKYRKPLNINIGVVIFGFIFVYIIYNIYAYLMTEHIAVYEVGQGTIAENNTYQGLILREEKIIYSDYAGDIDYYIRDTAKTSYQNLVYSIDENGDVSDKIGASANENAEFDNEDYKTLRDTLSGFDNSYASENYYQVYTFKEELNAELMEAVNQNALDSLGDYVTNAQSNQTFHLINSSEPGVVVYYTDGYENVTAQNFTPDQMNALNYTKVNLKQRDKISAGDPAYKLITSEDWNIIFPVADSCYERLKDDSVVKIQFKKDGISCWVNFELQKIQDKYYIILSLKDHMVRFANERFIEIELLIDEKTGLKIPNSSITQKDFFTVPKKYFTRGGDSKSYGLLIQQPDESGKNVMVFVSTDIYEELNDLYYVAASEQLQSGTVIQLPDSNETYTIRDTVKLDGVYSVNKGYAVFKKIDVLFHNEEYTIVRTGTDYGIALYDHIALEGDKISEGELIH